jgi:hypothetical protein
LQVTLDKEPRFRAFDYEERHGQMLSRIGQRNRRHLCRVPLVRPRSLPRLWKKMARANFVPRPEKPALHSQFLDIAEFSGQPSSSGGLLLHDFAKPVV